MCIFCLFLDLYYFLKKCFHGFTTMCLVCNNLVPVSQQSKNYGVLCVFAMFSFLVICNYMFIFIVRIFGQSYWYNF